MMIVVMTIKMMFVTPRRCMLMMLMIMKHDEFDDDDGDGSSNEDLKVVTSDFLTASSVSPSSTLPGHHFVKYC